MAVCFIGGAKVGIVATQLFSIGWTVADTGAHWQRAYQVAPGALVVHDLRAKDLPKGEDPLPGYTKEGDWYVWHTSRRAFPVISFGSEGGTKNWEICADGKCQPLTALTGAPEGSDVNAVPCKAEPEGAPAPGAAAPAVPAPAAPKTN